MTTETHKFIGNIEEDWGWEFPEALIAIRTFSKTAQDTGVSEDDNGNYVMESKFEAIIYTANYFANAKTQADGKRSKPLYNKDDEDLKHLLKVDLTTNESIQVLAKDLSPLDKMFKLIELDVERRFASEDSKDLVII